MPERNAHGFTAEEAAAVEARGQEIYAAMRASDIEAAAQARAEHLYRVLNGQRQPVAPTEANAAPDAG